MQAALREPLKEAFRDHRHPTEGRMAASVLREYLSEEPEALADLLMDADPLQFAELLLTLKDHGDRAA